MGVKYISIEKLYPDLYKIIPGWIRGTYYCITGATGSGKSKFTRWSFVEWPYKYCTENNIPFKIVYFALEESAEYFWSTIILSKLHEKHGIELTYYQYKGFHPGLTDEAKRFLPNIEEEVSKMKEYVKVYDDVKNPTGMLKTVDMELANVGRIKNGNTIKDTHGNDITFKSFEYNDPDFHFIVVADHIGLLSPENNSLTPVNTTHLAISKWSDYVISIICKRYNAIVVNVHQQEMAGENNDNFKLGRLEPSEAKLGDNKIIGRDYMVTLGLFNPYKYGLTTYLKYNITKLQDNFRSLHILKHRNGKANYVKGLFFQGTNNKFTEL